MAGELVELLVGYLVVMLDLSMVEMREIKWVVSKAALLAFERVGWSGE